MRQIYLDYNATTPIAPSVLEAMQPFLTGHFGNPSSDHAMGRAVAEGIEDARTQVAGLLGCDREEIVFTCGGTESNNMALKGVMFSDHLPGDGHLIISSIEHPAIVEPARFLERLGFDVTVVGCDSQGVVQPTEIERAIRKDTRLVSIMHANNEIGTIQPIKQIAEICHKRDIIVHSDAAQSVGKVRTLVDELNVDMLTVAGHKLYGPKGIGALFVRDGLSLEPFMHGASQESGMRAGTENAAYAVGLGQACQMASKCLEESSDRLSRLRDRLMDHLTRAIGSELLVNGQSATRLPNTLSVIFPGVNGHELLKRAPEICASTGSACHAGTDNMSATSKSLGLTVEQARGTVRLSVGWSTAEEEIDRAAELLIGAWESLITSPADA